MNDELKNIELETAKIKLQREQLLLQKEIDKRGNLKIAATHLSSAFGMLTAAVKFFFFLALTAFLGAILGGVLWVIVAMLVFFNATNQSWEFMARVGGALAKVPDAITAMIFIGSVLYTVFAAMKIIYKK